MDCKVLDIITECLTNERLDNIIFRNEQYKETDAKSGRTMQIFEELLDAEQQKRFDEYLEAENQRVAIYTRMSYEQGMRDIVDLIASLIKD